MPHQPRLISEPESEYHLSPEEQARKDEYRERLRQHLQDPEFRQIPGFPIGEDEAILALSDPPYYTACPNPFLPEIIEQWQAERAELRRELSLPEDNLENGNGYHREPFAADVSEGKNNPIYNAHSYHTKVPHPAIMRYILHYTDPGDIVFDGFCGTGMTGVAAQLCGDRKEVEKLGYYVDADGWIYDHPPEIGGDGGGEPISRLGTRKTILNDLSPAATFIAYNYNTPVDVEAFEHEAHRILDEVEEECGWMYETWHPHYDDPNRVKARINYTVWSEVFACPACSQEIVFYEEAFNAETGRVQDEFRCPHCGTDINKRDLELLFVADYDQKSNSVSRSPRRIPVLINYQVGKAKFEKPPDHFDLKINQRIADLPVPPEIPLLELPDMQMRRVGRMATVGVSYIHDFFLPRQAQALAALWRNTTAQVDPRVRKFLFFLFEQAISGMSILNRYQPVQYGRLGGSQVNRAMSGVFYVASQISEVSPWYNLGGKLKRLHRAFQRYTNRHLSLISTENLGSLHIADSSLDYIFTDPPFGENIYYSDLNILVESWHGIRTTPKTEVIVDRVRKKVFSDYERMMEHCFSNYHRSLKPGRWMTVEFHNSKNSVWNAIQLAILNSGFIIADVRILDKKQRSFQQAMSTSAVKQDLVISAYKPSDGLEERFRLQMGSADGAWSFVRYHLSKLPVAVRTNGDLEALGERQAHLLFDRMVAFHIQRGATVPLSATEFYAGLDERIPQRDGMYFLPEQVPEYDKAHLEAESVAQLTFFVSDEKTAIQWLRQQLDPQLGGESQTYQDIQPKFLRQLHQAKHEALPELSTLLEQNFLQDEAGFWYVPDPNKASDLEALRRKALLREFNTYLDGTKKLRQFRTEAIRAGFADAYQRKDFPVILKMAERLPQRVLQEDPDLLMYYDAASLRDE